MVPIDYLKGACMLSMIALTLIIPWLAHMRNKEYMQ